MSGAMSRNKGARGEREVATIVREHGWTHARRVLSGDGKQPGDIAGGPRGWVLEVGWWDDVVACLRTKVDQAEQERVAAEARYAAAIVRLGGGGWVAAVTMRNVLAAGLWPDAEFLELPPVPIPQRLRLGHDNGGPWWFNADGLIVANLSDFLTECRAREGAR